MDKPLPRGPSGVRACDIPQRKHARAGAASGSLRSVRARVVRAATGAAVSCWRPRLGKKLCPSCRVTSKSGARWKNAADLRLRENRLTVCHGLESRQIGRFHGEIGGLPIDSQGLADDLSTSLDDHLVIC